MPWRSKVATEHFRGEVLPFALRGAAFHVKHCLFWNPRVLQEEIFGVAVVLKVRALCAMCILAIHNAFGCGIENLPAKVQGNLVTLCHFDVTSGQEVVEK